MKTGMLSYPILLLATPSKMCILNNTFFRGDIHNQYFQPIRVLFCACYIMHRHLYIVQINHKFEFFGGKKNGGGVNILLNINVKYKRQVISNNFIRQVAQNNLISTKVYYQKKIHCFILFVFNRRFANWIKNDRMCLYTCIVTVLKPYRVDIQKHPSVTYQF